MPWSVGNQPHNLQNFVKFNVDSYKDFVNSEQAPRVIREQRTGNQPIQEEKSGYDYTALGLAVGSGVLLGGLVGLLSKNPQSAVRAGYYSTRGVAATLGKGISTRNVVTGGLLGGVGGSVEEGIRQNLQAGSKPQFFGNLPAQYKAPKTPTVRLGNQIKDRP